MGTKEVAMTSLTEEIKHELASHNDEFKSLLRHHHDHERRLAELASKTFLSTDEEVEEKRLKKEKLHLKDRMEEIAREHRARISAH
jgi:uncharacterized protein YdcH (DUF465 family)